MFTANQIVAHLVGDFVLQSGWMVEHKSKNWMVATIHSLVYSVPFLLLGPSILAWGAIVASHVLIDRLALSVMVCWLSSRISPPSAWSMQRSEAHAHFGYPDKLEDYRAFWLNVIVDNTIHIVINGLALYYL